MNSDLLKGKLRESKLTQADAANKIGISPSRFNAKLNNAGNAEFSLGEARALKKLLGLAAEQVDEFFFS